MQQVTMTLRRNARTSLIEQLRDRKYKGYSKGMLLGVYAFLIGVIVSVARHRKCDISKKKTTILK